MNSRPNINGPELIGVKNFAKVPHGRSNAMSYLVRPHRRRRGGGAAGAAGDGRGCPLNGNRREFNFVR
ncbi:hypothetical protein EVAR_10018_1 [Eumeta japonica]|uniref:Uncharacterized protein n=1 Tax=Eumeta variegata TaxID=151549 RepID=A0A4C1TR54_EUMVA|nr:hypothetical protein EVAR_10018_1 [Eumeta japonica]